MRKNKVEKVTTKTALHYFLSELLIWILTVFKGMTSLAMPPDLFALVILEIGCCFLLRPAWTVITYFMLPAIAGWQEHGTQQLADMESHYLAGLASNCDPPDLISQVVSIIGMSTGAKLLVCIWALTLPGIALQSSRLCLLSIWDYRHGSSHINFFFSFFTVQYKGRREKVHYA
jgi:hypothetical protein